LGKIPRRGIGFGVARYLGSDEALRGAISKLPRPEVAFNYFGIVSRAGAADVAPDDEMLVGRSLGPRNRRQHLIEVNARIAGGRLQVKWTFATEFHRHATIDRIAQRFVAALQEIIEAGDGASADVLTPSDFPQARTSREDLEALLRRIGGTPGNAR